MQLIQNCVIKASINIVKLLHKQGDTDSEAFELGSNALALLGHSNKLLNNKRKESHKNDFDPKFFPLTSPSLPFTDFLYGNETDINKNVKDIQDMSRIGKVGRAPRGRGYRNFPYRRGGRSLRRGYRGRGFKPSETASFSSAGYSKNFKEGQKK
jgi:hypothetical protein